MGEEQKALERKIRILKSIIAADMKKHDAQSCRRHKKKLRQLENELRSVKNASVY